MADDLEVLPPDHDEEGGGGPVKTFLEHLEDLRWTLLKCVLAIALGMIVAISASPFLIKILTWPLVLAQEIKTDPIPRAVLLVGTNVLEKIPLSQFPIPGLSAQEPDTTTNSWSRWMSWFQIPGFATNHDVYFRMVPVPVPPGGMAGLTNGFLTAWVPDASPPHAATFGKNVVLKTFGPMEPFSLAIKVGLYGGLALSAPFVLFFLAQFIMPALHVHERRFVYRVAGFGSMLFFLGVAFCYLVMLVVSLSATVGFSNWLGFSSDEWRGGEYINFVCWFLLGMGVAFELPLVLLTLVKAGILDAERLSKLRMYWVVSGLALAGFITPDGNPLTMLLMFLPLHGLYEISLLIARYWERIERKREAAASEGQAGAHPS